MSTVTLGDVQAALPGFSLSDTTTPNTLQVSRYIVDVEAEVRATLAAAGAGWPAAGDEGDIARVMRRTILDGVICLVLRAQYSRLASAAIPNELDRSCMAYETALKRIPTLARGITAQNPAKATGTVPTYDRDRRAPRQGETFGEWQARESYWDDRRRWGRRRGAP